MRDLTNQAVASDVTEHFAASTTDCSTELVYISLWFRFAADH